MVIKWLMMVNSNDWLVVDRPLWKMMDNSSVGIIMIIPNMMGKIIQMFQTTNQIPIDPKCVWDEIWVRLMMILWIMKHGYDGCTSKQG